MVIVDGAGNSSSVVLKHSPAVAVGEIRIQSRDVKKQNWMRYALQVLHPERSGKMRFYVGDVRSVDSVRDAMYGLTACSTWWRSRRFPHTGSSRWRWCEPTLSARTNAHIL